MRAYLINLDRRADRLAAMQAEAAKAGIALTRVAAIDATRTDPAARDSRFAASGPLGPLPSGDKCCTLSHRLAWQALVDSGEPHAVVLEDDVRLSPETGALLSGWRPGDIGLLKLEHYGPMGQRILVGSARTLGDGFTAAPMLSRHTGAAAYLLTHATAERLLAVQQFNLPVDHLLFNPNNSPLFAALAPWQLMPAIARQQEFVGVKSDIETTRRPLRKLDLAYARRELIRFGYDLRLVPRQLALLASGRARFIAITTR